PSSVFAIGGGTHVIWIDPDHDLVTVLRWIDGGSIGGFMGRLMAASGEGPLPLWSRRGLREPSSLEERRGLVELGQDLVAAAVGYLDEHAIDTGLAVGGELGRVGRRREYRDRQGFGIAVGCGGCLPQALNGALGFEAAARPRKPPVAKLHHALERM